MTQKYSRASTLFFDQPLALLPGKMDEIRVFWESKLAGAHIDFEERMEPFAVSLFALGEADMVAWLSEDTEAATAASASGGGQIAVIPMHGVLAPRMNMMMAMSGGTSTAMFGNALREQVNNPQVKAIIVDCDSPGGSVAGMQELADTIYSLRGTKPIVAVVNHLGASAAYSAISQMDEIVASPSSQLGHIGVASLLVDRSGELEQAGIKVMQVTAGKYKAEQATGSDLVPMTDSKVQHAQQSVDEAYSMFVDSVARGRGVKASDVRNGYGEGRVVGAQEAVRLGMADRVATLDQTIQRFASGGRVSRRAATLEERAAAAMEASREMIGEPKDDGTLLGLPVVVVEEAAINEEQPIDPLAIETEQRQRAYEYEKVN